MEKLLEMNHVYMTELDIAAGMQDNVKEGNREVFDDACYAGAGSFCKAPSGLKQQQKNYRRMELEDEMAVSRLMLVPSQKPKQIQDLFGEYDSMYLGA